jgi:hypothetical protein
MRVVLEQSLEGQLVINVYYVTKASPVVSIDLTTIAEIFADWWTADLSDFLSNDLSLQRVLVTNMSAADGEQIIFTDGLPVNGGITTESEPNNVALVVSRLSGFAGRSSRGRVYLAGLASASVGNNLVASTVQAGVVSAHNTLNATIISAGYIPVTASFISDGEPRGFALTRVITDWAANNRVDTQRRRLPGEGL